MGVALGPCIVPAAGTPSFTLGDVEIELGLGIHGEAGIRRVPMAPAQELVDQLLATIITTRTFTAGARVAVLVNGLGGTPPMELDVVTAAALGYLARVGLVVERLWCGRFLTSLEMPGVSLSLLSVDDERLRLLDAPTDASAWPSAQVAGGINLERPRLPAAKVPSNGEVPLHADGRAHAATLSAGLEAVVAALLENETHLTTLDQAVGDGDLGISLARAASAIRDRLAKLPLNDPAATLGEISGLIRRVVGGTSGPLYAVLVLRAAQSRETGPCSMRYFRQRIHSLMPYARRWSIQSLGDRPFAPLAMARRQPKQCLRVAVGHNIWAIGSFPIPIPAPSLRPFGLRHCFRPCAAW
jgi:dihydroxyacetone kinase